MFYSGLTELDEVLSPKLALAESIEQRQGDHLDDQAQEGCAVSRRQELTAEDVVFSLKRHHDPATASKAVTRADTNAKESTRPARPAPSECMHAAEADA